jgi:Arc/MetJ family transcription regulator
MTDIKRTSLNLDFDLVRQAEEILGTRGTTDTVRQALREVVRRERIRRLLAVRFDHLPETWLDDLRSTGRIPE